MLNGLLILLVDLGKALHLGLHSLILFFQILQLVQGVLESALCFLDKGRELIFEFPLGFVPLVFWLYFFRNPELFVEDFAGFFPLGFEL